MPKFGSPGQVGNGSSPQKKTILSILSSCRKASGWSGHSVEAYTVQGLSRLPVPHEAAADRRDGMFCLTG